MAKQRTKAELEAELEELQAERDAIADENASLKIDNRELRQAARMRPKMVSMSDIQHPRRELDGSGGMVFQDGKGGHTVVRPKQSRK